MGNISDHRFTQTFQFFQTVTHHVECRAELADFVAATGFDPCGKISFGDLAAGFTHLHQWTQHTSGQQIAEQRGKHQSPQTRPEQITMHGGKKGMMRIGRRHHVLVHQHHEVIGGQLIESKPDDTDDHADHRNGCEQHQLPVQTKIHDGSRSRKR